MRILIAVVVAVVAGAHVAHADCGSPRTALSPPTGTLLPPHATIYLFDTGHETSIHDALAITDDDDTARGPLRFRATRMAASRGYTVHRIELDPSSHARSIRATWNGAPLARYPVGDVTAEDHAAVVDVTRKSSIWLCSFTDVIELAVEGNAIAYRIDWDDDRTTIIADARVMWGAASAGGHQTLELGHPNCMAYNVEPGLLAKARSFEVYALFADGKVQHIGTSIAQLSDDHVRLPVELIWGADVRIPRRFSVGLAGAIVVVLLGRRRRRLRIYDARFHRG